MIQPTEVAHVPYADYLALEAASETKHEYLRGEVWRWRAARWSTEDSRPTSSGETLRVIGDRPCAVFTSDVRVRIDATDKTTYPDAFVVCGPRQTSPVDPHAVTNPLLIVEVLSEGTERSDRGEKFAHYRRLPSLREVVFVGQDPQRIEVYSRGPRAGFSPRVHAGSTSSCARWRAGFPSMPSTSIPLQWALQPRAPCESARLSSHASTSFGLAESLYRFPFPSSATCRLRSRSKRSVSFSSLHTPVGKP